MPEIKRNVHTACNLAYDMVVGYQIGTAAGCQTDIGAVAHFASGKQDPHNIAALKIYDFWNMVDFNLM